MSTTTPLRGMAHVREGFLRALHIDLQVAQEMLSRLSGDVSAGTSASIEELRTMLRQVARDARVGLTELEAVSSADRRRFLTSTGEQLTDWRAALDDLRVQSKLAEMTSRQRTEHAITAAERAWSVAQQRFQAASDDFDSSWNALCKGINDAMRQLADAVRLAIRSLTESAAA